MWAILCIILIMGTACVHADEDLPSSDQATTVVDAMPQYWDALCTLRAEQ